MADPSSPVTPAAPDPTDGAPAPPAVSKRSPFNEAQQGQIIAALFRREDQKTITANHGVSERQLRRISNSLKTFGTFHPPSNKKMGRPTCLNKEVEEDLRAYVAAQPLALLVDMQKHIQDKYNIKCSRASLSRRIREMGYTRAIIKRGFRSEDQAVPTIAPEDMLRIASATDFSTAAPNPADVMDEDEDAEGEVTGLNGGQGNGKRARYAWLLHTPPAVKVKGVRGKKKGTKDPVVSVTEQVQNQAQVQAQVSAQLHNSVLDPIIVTAEQAANKQQRRARGEVAAARAHAQQNAQVQAQAQAQQNGYAPAGVFMPPPQGYPTGGIRMGGMTPEQAVAMGLR